MGSLKMSSKPTITFVTGNAKKFEQYLAIFGPDFPYDIVRKDIDMPELQGTSQEICTDKCLQAYKLVNGPVIVQDESLCFNAMHGLPGPYIKWFSKELKAQGLYNMLKHWEDKSAYALCTFGYTDHDLRGQVVLFEGRTDGTVVEPKATGNDFFWDSCFLPDGFQQTYAEMDVNVKNTISHYFR